MAKLCNLHLRNIANSCHKKFEMSLIKPAVISIFITLFFLVNHKLFAQNQVPSIDGELQKWHKITLNFEGPDLSENYVDNPFLNYRLNVTFSHENETFVVPGFYAADGNASESGAINGNIWKVRFRPNSTGKWTYKVSFRKGENIAVSDDQYAGEATSFDGANGNFTIVKSDKKGADFRSKGRLKYVNERYLQFEDTKEYFLKGGAGSPENLLGYYEFDQTPATHYYKPHANDWKPGDPTWQQGKGKNIIGAMNYLASKKMNAMYFLTMNVQGDGNDVWPWINSNERYRYDCSKLDQWEIVFDHMTSLGIMLHLFTQETENELLLDIGETRTQRKLYYRELIARFGHHLGLTWNLGEENGYVKWSPKAQNDDDRRQSATYLRTHDPYKNHIALHTHARISEQDDILTPLLGFSSLTGPSIQLHHPKEVNHTTQKWILESQKTGHQWVVPLDEIGPANVGAKPDADDPDHDEMRSAVLWGNLMAGGSGVEWYFGYKFAHMDLNCEDFRSRELLWNQTKYALDFFQSYVPFHKMKAANGLTQNTDDFVFAKNGSVYVVYMPQVAETILDLTGVSAKFSIQWYNPRTGGILHTGTIKSVKGGNLVDIGYPPNREKDWVALLSAKNPKQTKVQSSRKKGLQLNALTDFQIKPSKGKATYYKDEKNKALAINAANVAMRNNFAEAKTVFKGETSMYRLSLATITENDGESVYIVKLNGTVIDTLTNPATSVTYNQVNHNLGVFFVATNDIIEIASKAVTNGKIPENNETAWSRGRWSKLILAPSPLVMKEQLKSATAFEAANGFITVEAEDFQYSTNNGSPRFWNKKPADKTDKNNHSNEASNGFYIEALPDTRITHDDALIDGENFFPEAGTGGMVSYKVNFGKPGKYYVWARAYSSGPEDNGIHVGIDGTWPESGARMQWCKGKNEWTWSSAQRVPENHCGVPQAISLDVKEAGTHIISFAMREDGFELDQWIMTLDKNFEPK